LVTSEQCIERLLNCNSARILSRLQMLKYIFQFIREKSVTVSTFHCKEKCWLWLIFLWGIEIYTLYAHANWGCSTWKLQVLHNLPVMTRRVDSLKYLDKFKRENSSYKKDKVYINMCPEMSVLSLMEILNPTANMVRYNYVIVCLNWHKTFTVHLLNLITLEFLLFVKSQFTTNTQHILLLNHWTRLIMGCHKISEAPLWLQMVRQA
jgi:hypothetical protein